jgi:predicted nucleic acid-binding protein
VPIVVGDTSPVRALVHVGRLDLLPALFEDVVVPPAVVDELRAPAGPFTPIDVRQMPALRIVQPLDMDRILQFSRILDRGESEALALALEIHADVVLMDELAGRAVAESVGLVPIGVVGILLRAKANNLVIEVKPLLDRMIHELKFFVSPALRAQTLRRVGEDPQEP